MKTRIYLRVARDGAAGYKVKVDASTKSHADPLYKSKFRGEKEFLPTVGFGVDFDIPDELFSKANIVVAEINLSTKEARVLGEIPVIKPVIKKK